jgi:hypothetical protein
MKIDVWRMLVIYKYGGIYTDIDNWPGPEMNDTFPIKPLDSFFATSDPYNRCTQHFFAMEPDHEIAYFSMMTILENLSNLNSIIRPKVVQVTGPQAMHTGYLKAFPDTDWWRKEALKEGFHKDIMGRQIHKIGGRWRAAKYMGQFLGATIGEYVEYEGQNISKRERIELVSGILHWTHQKKTNKMKSMSCWDYLYRLDHNISTTEE